MSVELPGKILEIQVMRNNRLGLVQFGETRRPIFLDLVPDARIGDYVTAHVGFATGRVTEDAATAIYAEHGLGVEHDLQLEEAGPGMQRRVKPR
jgi:hydrogenase expression/formation protein HypC